MEHMVTQKDRVSEVINNWEMGNNQEMVEKKMRNKWETRNNQEINGK